MKCSACGSDVAADAAFCHKCGQKIGGAGQDGTSSPPGARVHSSVEAAQRNIGNDPESTLWEGGYSAKAMVGTWLGLAVASVLTVVLAVVVTLGAALPIVIGILVLAWLVALGYYGYRRIGVTYKLTTQRFIHTSGIFMRTTNRIELIDVDDVEVFQNLIERFFKLGTIRIVSSDRTDPQLDLKGIDDVQNVSSLLDDARRKERRRRGLHIEQI